MVSWRVFEFGLDIKGLGIVKVVIDLVKFSCLEFLRFSKFDIEEFFLFGVDGLELVFFVFGRFKILGLIGFRLGILTIGVVVISCDVGFRFFFFSIVILVVFNWLYFFNFLVRLFRGVCWDIREDKFVFSFSCLVRIMGRKIRLEFVKID